MEDTVFSSKEWQTAEIPSSVPNANLMWISSTSSRSEDQMSLSDCESSLDSGARSQSGNRRSDQLGHETSPHFRGSWSSFLLGSGGAAFVAVVQATDLTHGHNWPDIPSLNRWWFWRVLLQRQMRSRSVVVIEIGSKDSPQRAFIEHDHVVETFAPDRSDHSFHISALPWRGWCRENLFYSHFPTCALQL